MADTQTVIVYRNRAEHDFWESGMAIPLGAGLLVFLVVMVAIMSLAERTIGRWRTNTSSKITWIAAIISAVLGFATFHFLLV